MKKRKLFLAISLAFIAVPLNAECPPTPMPYTIIDPILEAPVTKYTGDITGNGEATQWTNWTFKIRLSYNDTIAQTVGGSVEGGCSWTGTCTKPSGGWNPEDNTVFTLAKAEIWSGGNKVTDVKIKVK